MSGRMLGTFPRRGAMIGLSALLGAGILSKFRTRGLSAARRSFSTDVPRVADKGAPRCARGLWRLVDPTELRQSLLSLSHILIRHKRSESRLVPLSILDWRIDMERQSRTVDEALALAHKLKAQAESSPQSWQTLAHEYSDDPVTRAQAGRLGVFPASEFLIWPNILDCLADMQDGGYAISESGAGIHIFRRDPPPAPQKFAAKRIVIGYRDAGFLKYVARSEVPQRSKTEALAFASAIRERALRENFDELAQQYSEHRDIAQGGDIGVWSTQEPTNFPRLLDDIVRTPVGGLTPVLDSELGFQLFFRTAVTGRPEFAMESARFAFEPGSNDSARGSQTAALSQARAYLDSWRSGSKRPRDPRYRGNECPMEVWTSGRGPHRVEPALRKIEVGQIVPEPIQSDFSYLVARRLEPPNSEQALARIWLPQPTEPDIPYFIAASSDKVVEHVLTSVESEMDPSVRDKCEWVRRTLFAELKACSVRRERQVAAAGFAGNLALMLATSTAQVYEDKLRARVRDRLLHRNSI